MIEYIIPINPEQEKLDEFNEKHGTDFKSFDFHCDEAVTKFVDELYRVIDETPHLYIGDCIKVKFSIEYEPEDK